MAVLTTAGRKRIKPANFAVPSKNGYPIQDEAHARNALTRAAQFGSPSEQAEVRAEVAKKYPGIEQSKGPQAKKTGNSNGKNRNGNGGSRNGNGNSNGRLASKLTQRLAARDRD